MTEASIPRPQGIAPQPDQPARLGGNLICVLSMLAWSAGFPAAELLLETWPPLALITARLLLSVGILIPIWALVEGSATLRHAPWSRGIRVGAISFGLGTFLLLQAQSMTDPVTVALFASASPLVATLIELVQGQRRLTGRFALGLVASVIGGAVATSALSPAELGPGALCALASIVLFCWGSMATVRDFPTLGPVGRSTITLSGAALIMVPALLIASLTGLDVLPRHGLVASDIGPLLVYALVGMALSQVLWILSVGQLGVALASFHINIAPFYVMLILQALGVPWSWPQAIGAGIVAIGVILSQPPRRR